MKTISGALASHLEQQTTTLATCWKVTLAVISPPTVMGFTDHDRDLVVGGVTYRAASGYTRSAIQSSAGLQVDNLDIEGVLDSTFIKEADVRAGLWDYAEIEVFVVNWADLTQGTLKQRKGRLGEVRTGRQAFLSELRGLLQNLQQNVGRLYGAACDADLFDARCGLNAASFLVTGTITSFTSARVFADSARAEAAGYFDAGKITFTSGANTGLSMEVKIFTQAGGLFELQLPMPYAVAVGNAYQLLPGCLKRLTEDCKTKFNNVVNFRGFPHVPGLDRMVSGGL